MVGSNPPLCRAPAGISIRGQAHLAACIINPDSRRRFIANRFQMGQNKRQAKTPFSTLPDGRSGKDETHAKIFQDQN